MLLEGMARCYWREGLDVLEGRARYYWTEGPNRRAKLLLIF